MSPTILLVDDHELSREGLRSLLESDPAFSVVGTASDGVEAVRLVRELNPDVVVLDVAMPVINGIEATRKIAGMKATTKVIGLSMHDDLRFVTEMMGAGARGYLLKDSALEEIHEGIRTVVSGGIALSRRINDLMILDYLQGRKAQSPLAMLNSREREVVRLLTEGKKLREIAELLGISVRTVETHRKNILTKLKVNNVAELTRLTLHLAVPRP